MSITRGALSNRKLPRAGLLNLWGTVLYTEARGAGFKPAPIHPLRLWCRIKTSA